MKVIASVTIDFDPDAATTANNRQSLELRSIELCPKLFSILSDFGVRSTCFLRMDDQIRSEKGSYAFLFREYKSLWDSLLSQGHEMGLHPHLYAFSESKKQFEPNFDPSDACRQFGRIHHAVLEEGLSFSSLRIGESFHCSPLMNLADQLGYSIDSTAIPGRVRSDDVRRIDWGPTPNYPYFPSVSDHRISGSDNLKLLEIPMTSALFRADYDDGPKLRYCSLTYRSDVFSDGLAGHFRSLDKGSVHSLVFIIHPGEFLSSNRTNKDAGLYAFDVDSLRTNLQATLDLVRDNGGELVFAPLREMPSFFHDEGQAPIL